LLGLTWHVTSVAATPAAPRPSAPRLSAPRPSGPRLAAPAVEPEANLETVAQVTDWVIASRDNGSLPFVIIDKVAAEVLVFAADGQFKGAAPALLGSARGDHSSPGVGDRELSNIPPKERTTPAGRFIAAFGPATGGKTVLWVDYGTAISMHPVIVANPAEHRLERLQSPSPKDNRITFGCINVPAAFYKDVVLPTFEGTSGIVYILPEKPSSLAKYLPDYQPPPVTARAQPEHSSDVAAADVAADAKPDHSSSADVATADVAVRTAPDEARSDAADSGPALRPYQPLPVPAGA
jgi:hypothetical protein